MMQIAQASSGIRAITSLSAGLVSWNGSDTFSAVDPATFATASHTHNASDINAGTLDNARVNWASPSAIGGTTPAAITGTTITGNHLVLNGAPGKIRPAVDSTTAIQFANAAGTAFLTLDTTNGWIEHRRDQNTTTTMLVRNETAGTLAAAMFVAQTSSSRNITFGMFSTSYSNVPAWTGKAAVVTAIPSALLLSNYDAAGIIQFQTGGFGSANIGIGINASGNLEYLGQTSTTNRAIGSIIQTWATATDASRKGRVIHNVYDTAAREAIRLEASGSAAMLGFFGVNAVVRPTALTAADAGAINSGDAGTDTIIGNIRTRLGEVETKLQALGLLT